MESVKHRATPPGCRGSSETNSVITVVQFCAHYLARDDSSISRSNMQGLYDHYTVKKSQSISPLRYDEKRLLYRDTPLLVAEVSFKMRESGG